LYQPDRGDLTMKKLLVFVPVFFLGFLGTAHAEFSYNLKQQGYQAKVAQGGSPWDPDGTYFDPVPVEEISNSYLTFSGNAAMVFDYDYLSPSSCCSLSMGNQGSFTVQFDQPVKSVGLDIIPVHPGYASAFEDLYDNATVSAVYRNNEGDIVGQSSITASWLGSFEYGDWRWNNAYNGHESAFGVTNINGFSEVTFSVDGGDAGFLFKGMPYYGPLNVGSNNLFFTYLDPNHLPPIPEPQTYAMMMAGLGMLGFTAKRRKASMSKIA
ncbi:MAG TPA: PEP-CTERM sorting domain-containing protein, partial [Methylophilaceae bacterium]|nr:PEP-CTERM sorting domain-containing protein [Methylophilaceae bacterium]